MTNHYLYTELGSFLIRSGRLEGGYDHTTPTKLVLSNTKLLDDHQIAELSYTCPYAVDEQGVRFPEAADDGSFIDNEGDYVTVTFKPDDDGVVRRITIFPVIVPEDVSVSITYERDGEILEAVDERLGRADRRILSALVNDLKYVGNDAHLE